MKSKKSLDEVKLSILSKCSEMLNKSESTKSISPFAVYIDEKLSRLNERNRRVAEKKVTEVLFEAEMAEESISPNYIPSMSNLCTPDAGNFSRAPRYFPWSPNFRVDLNKGNTSSFMDMLKNR